MPDLDVHFLKEKIWHILFDNITSLNATPQCILPTNQLNFILYILYQIFRPKEFIKAEVYHE